MNYFPDGRSSGNSLAISWLLISSAFLTTVSFADYTFTDVTPQAGVANADHPHFGAAWCDYDSDGWLDLYVVNDDDNTLHQNQGNFLGRRIAGTGLNHPGLLHTTGCYLVRNG